MIARARTAAVVAVLLLAAVVMLVITGTGRHPSVAGTPVTIAQDPVVTARDGAVRAARDDTPALLSFESTNPEGFVDRMAAVSTGELLATIEANRADTTSKVRASGVTTTGSVLAVAASAVDPRGTVTVLVLARVVSTRQGAQQAPSLQRLQLTMTRTPQGWKVSALAEVPVGP